MSNTQRYVRILPSAVESNLGRWYEHHVGAVLPIHHMSKHNDVEVYILYSPMFSTNTYMIEVYHTKEVYVYDEPRVLPTAKPMKVRVVKAEPLQWYYKWIGLDVDVVKESDMLYGVKSGLLFAGYIRKEDCEIVTEPEHEKMSDEQSAFLQRISELEARVKYELSRLRTDMLELIREHIKPQQPAPPLGMSDHAEYDGIMSKLKNQDEATYHSNLSIEQIEQMKKEVEFQVGTTQPQRDHVKTESNLERAKRLYPKGTDFRCAENGWLGTSTGEWVVKDENIMCNYGGYVFYNGQWAEIVQDEPAVSLTAEQAEVLQQTFEKQLKSEPTLPGRDKPRVNPAEVKTWELTIDIPEWGLKKGDRSQYVTEDKEVRLDTDLGMVGLPASIMPHIAKAVG